MKNIDNPDNQENNKSLEEFLLSQFSFRYNTVIAKAEYKPIGSATYSELTDYVLNSISLLMERNKVRCPVSRLRTLLNSDFIEVHDPVKSILSNLPPYNEEHDYINDLASTVKTTDQQLWGKCLKKWFVAWVASFDDHSINNQTVIVLNGTQGIGKSRWLSKLVPGELKKYVYAGTINPDNKDTLIYLSECVLINLDELENLTRNQVGSLKEIITKEKIKVRRPYGYVAENLPRRASFVGSVNSNEFLTDTTGNRRFLCFEAEEINYEHEVDIYKVLAQAYFLYKSGYRFWFNQEEIAEINKANEKFRSISLEEEALITHFEACEPGNDAHYLTNTQILDQITTFIKISINQGAKKRLGEALHKHGFSRVKRNNRYVYAVKYKACANVTDFDLMTIAN